MYWPFNLFSFCAASETSVLLTLFCPSTGSLGVPENCVCDWGSDWGFASRVFAVAGGTLAFLQPEVQLGV